MVSSFLFLGFQHIKMVGIDIASQKKFAAFIYPFHIFMSFSLLFSSLFHTLVRLKTLFHKPFFASDFETKNHLK